MSRLERQRRRNRSKGSPARVAFLALGVLVAALAIGALSAVGYVVSVATSGPSLDQLKARRQGLNSIIYAANGKKLGVIGSDILRQPVPTSSIPKQMMQATVAIEDRRFYKHKGVDFQGVIRAAIKNAKSGKTVQGGSTLTMQLIKNRYEADDGGARSGLKGFKRKIREAKLAEDLEDVHPGRAGKQWILTTYLNNVPYGTVGGQQAIGIQAASRVFFDKRAADLTLPEAAMLAGLPQAPTDYNPYLHPTQALQRRNEVLEQMQKSGAITFEQRAQAVAAPIGLHRSSYYTSHRESYFTDYVKNELIKKYGRETVREGGLKVYTTIDLHLQQLARAAIAKNLASPGDPSSALVSISPYTGHIVAMASSSNYGDSKFNLAAQSRRQPGSTMKPIVAMAAIRRGVDINKVSYVSHKLHFVDPTYGLIDVDNSDGATSGKRKTIFQGIVTSDNTVFQQLDLDLGPPAVTKTAYDMGITTKLKSYPAEALGGFTTGVSPLQMARAYATINNGGSRVRPVAVTKVVFPDGRVDRSMGRPESVKVFTDGETNEDIQAMKGNIDEGTGTAARFPGCAGEAGKTGTTSGFKDAWFNGMTPHLNTAVWVGFPQAGVPMLDVPGWPGEMFGGRAPAAIWHDYMSAAVDRSQCADWPKPKVPFVSQPFFGKYAKGGGAQDDYQDQGTTGPGFSPQTGGAQTGAGNGGAGAPDAGGQTGTGTGTAGTTKYPPTEYESPPQGAPSTASPSAPSPAAAAAGGTASPTG